MNMRRFLPRSVAALLALTALAASATLAQAQTYTVNFTTPWKEGQTFQSDIKASQKTRMVVSQGTQVLQQQVLEDTVASLKADAKALTFFPHGGLRKVSYTVRSLRVSLKNGPETDYLPAGTQIVVETIGFDVKSYFINDKVATEEQKKVLKLVTSSDEADYNDQTIFGPAKPVGLSETWQPALEKMKAALSKELGEIPSATGEMKLEAITGTGDKQVAVVSGKIVLSGFAPPLPPGITAKSGTFQMELDGRIPATRTGSKRVENSKITAHFVGETKIPTGALVSLTMISEITTASTLTFP